MSLPTRKATMAALDAAFAEYVGLAFRTAADNVATQHQEDYFRTRIMCARHTYAAAESVISEIGD